MKLESLPNIEIVLANRLRSVRIPDEESLRRTGSVAAFGRIAAEFGPHLPPLCYNLYSLEAAIRGHDWRLLDDAAKQELRERAGVADRSRPEKKRVATLQYIETHLHERLSLDQVAAIAHYSPYHIHRLFRRLRVEATGSAGTTRR